MRNIVIVEWDTYSNNQWQVCFRSVTGELLDLLYLTRSLTEARLFKDKCLAKIFKVEKY